MQINYKWQCIQVWLSKRWEKDNHILVSISIEDDDNWNEALKISNYRLDEMINKLQEAKDFIDKQDKDLDRDWVQWWYKFRD